MNPRALIRTNTELCKQFHYKMFVINDIYIFYGIGNKNNKKWINHFKNKKWINEINVVFTDDYKMNPYGSIYYSSHKKIFTDKFKLENAINNFYNH